MQDVLPFELERVADGVHAAVVTMEGGALGNAAIVDLGDATLVFDTCLTLAAARELRRAAEELTGRPPAYLVNSHFHADHVAGNQVFAPEAVVIATERTRELMRTDEFAAGAAAAVPRIERQLPETEDESRRSFLLENLHAYRAYLAETAERRLVLPTVTFERRLRIHGSDRSVELICHGGGHTSSDSFLHLPEDRVALMGDLLMVGRHAAFPHGDPVEWRRILTEVLELDLDRVVPGHGPVGTLDDVDVIRRYLEMVESGAGALARGELAREEATVPAPFDGLDQSPIFDINVDVLVRRLSPAGAGR
jgi:glyoxylase-like metal-dependent hydrolase (beta-lactamase superfamily II)